MVRDKNMTRVCSSHLNPFRLVFCAMKTGRARVLCSSVSAFLLVFFLTGCGGGGGSSSAPPPPPPPPTPTTTVHATVDVLTNRHAISSFIYGVNFPPNGATYIQDSGSTLVRWGGNASTRYNYLNFDTNAANDFYFVNRTWASPPDSLGNDSVAYVSNVKAAGGFPIMTIGMLPWVAKDSTSYSFSVLKYGSQCKVNPFNSDDGNGVKADCTTNITNNDPFDAHFAFRDDPAMGDPPGTVYRHPWVTLLAGAFGSGSCPVPSFFNTSCHFYNMDNEIDIWGGTHRDVHQSESGYNELRDTFLTEARAVKSWDPQAVRFGPVSCCWFFYWNLNSATDKKSTHAGIDFLPWWLNEVYWSDLVAGTRSLDAFDLHAYTEASGTGLSLAQQRTLTLRVTRDWWDASYTSEAWFGSNSVTTNQANDTKPFRIPRMRAVLNSIYPGTPLAMTEWNFVMVQANGEADFSTALTDVDAWGILGRERVSYSTRWTAADPSTPAYNSLKLYRNYDGAHHTFNSISLLATHDADPGLFSIYAATNPGGASLTLMAVNKDPVNAAQTT